MSLRQFYFLNYGGNNLFLQFFDPAIALLQLASVSLVFLLQDAQPLLQVHLRLLQGLDCVAQTCGLFLGAEAEWRFRFQTDYVST